jgi:hypothetical protein
MTDERGVPGIGGVEADAHDTSLFPLLAGGSVPLADDGAGEPVQAARERVHGAGVQQRGQQQVAVFGE